MSLTINTNMMSLTAQRNLSASQNKLSSAIERLSSGNRINSAKDDAAGLAISTRFTTQINGLNQAVRNANDGISLSQTTESALDEVTNNLQRIRELAVQSTNASNSSSDRAALDAEVQQRLSEVTRIATQTNFNGMKVLDGSAKNLSFQVGANVGEVISVGLNQGMKANQVGQLAQASVATTFPAGLSLANGDLTIGGTSVTGNFTDANSLATAINGVSAGLASVVNGEIKLTNGTNAAITVAGNKATSLGLNGTLAANTGTQTSTGVNAAVTAPAQPVTIAAGQLSIQVGSGTAFNISGTFKSTQDLADAINSQSSQGISAYVGQNGSLNIASAQALTITATAGSPAATLGFTSQNVAVGTGTLADSSIATVDGANATINRVDAALQSVSSLRSNLGAVQNRFESTISNLQNISQNLTSSRSAITDADFAQETANMSSAQILQQAGVSVLATANQSQQIVTKLLG
ncbi:flagellin [Luteibacter sp. PPL201]|uniref:Flagellin n=1 Tax=Luteibacter sahnii TaxID=3021977 RepID=A0ABT6BAM8_9GAMM|nr:flagellin [Luteibacter sp. PPL193]MDY1547119.1 flagellin [Luteibacter sp. PPL193]